MKALIISIGTGAKPGDEAVESLVSGITFSIKNTNPDKIFFIASEDSQHKTLPRVLKSIEQPHEVIVLKDPDDISEIFDQLSSKFKEIRKSFSQITVDYTSGTKAMAGALTIIGSLYEADTLSYVTGKRHGGIVVKGTEKLLSLCPSSIIVEKRLLEAVTFFDKCQFDTALLTIYQIENTIPDPSLLTGLISFKQALLAYSAWDKFDHQTAFDNLIQVKLACFDSNKAFLGKLLHNKPPEPYYIADIISNAKRRGEIEYKYDDAVARLYRVIELIAQYKLKNYGIDDTSNVSLDKVPPELIDEWKITEGKIKIGLWQDYQLLATKQDNLGKRFMADQRLKNLLQRRNESILAHGLKRVTRTDYEELHDISITYAQSTLENFDQLLSGATFAKWPV